MAAPVWTLSVDLQTKTASFTTGLADASSKAREYFRRIKDDSGDMAEGVAGASGRVNYSMMEARHSVMMLGEEVGVHLPRSITMFISTLGPLGPALEAAFPYLAIVLGATLLIEKIVKIGEAEEKVVEASHKLSDSMAEGINKAKIGILDATIEIRKLAGDPAWDLLAQKMQLVDAEKGIENVGKLEKAIAELLKAAPAAGTWNPFNWILGNDSDLEPKIQTLQEKMRGKTQTEQLDVVSDALALQSKILEQMKGQGDESEAALHNQQTYVDFLRQESELLQKQADEATLADQATQGKDRAERLKKEEEAAKKAEQEMLTRSERLWHAEFEYNKKRTEGKKKAAEEAEHLAAEEYAATNAVMKDLMDADKERSKIAEELGKEKGEHEKRMASLELQAAQNHNKDILKVRKSRTQELLDEQLKEENVSFAAEKKALDTELNTLDKYAKDHEVKVKQMQDREAELTQAHSNRLAQIRGQADEEQAKKYAEANTRMREEFARGFTGVIAGQENFASMMTSLGNQVAAGMLENSLKSIMALDMTKEKEAASAARKGYLAGWSFPWPANIVMAPALGAMAFAASMAFAEGGIVPGVERFDSVPARLMPGEAVIPRNLTEKLTTAANGDTGGTRITHVHRHTHIHNWHAIDGASVDSMLEKHGDKFERHVEGAMRKRNM